MNRHSKSLAGILGVALLVGSVAAGCARRSGADIAPTPIPRSETAVATVADQAAGTAAAEIATSDQPPTPLPTDSPTTAPATAQVKPTADPLDAELQGINQLLNGIDTSIAGSSTGGGE